MAGIDKLRFEEAPITSDTTAQMGKRHSAQAVDHHWKKDPAPTPGSPHDLTADDVKKALEELRNGKSRGIKEVPTEKDIFNLWEQLSKGGQQLPVPDHYYDRRMLPDGTIIGIRESDGYGPTLDVKYPPGVHGPTKVHLPPPPPLPPAPGPRPPIIAQPELPPILTHPPQATPPPQANHPPGALPPIALDHPPLPAWLQNTSPPGYQLSPEQPPPLTPWDSPDAPAPVPPIVTPDPPITLHMPELPPPSPDQQRGLLATVGGVVIGGLAILGRLGEGLRP